MGEEGINHLETAVAKLETEQQSFSSRLGKLESTVSDMAGGINTLLQRGSGWEATKGMIPQSTVMWGVGTLIALVSLILIVAQRSSSLVRDDLNGIASKVGANSSLIRSVKDQSLINQTRADERYRTQQHLNNDRKEWLRRIVDRGHASRGEHYAAMMQVYADLCEIEKAAATEAAELDYVQLQQDRRYQSIMDAARSKGATETRLKQLENWRPPLIAP